MQIVNVFYEIARQHLLINGFYYGKAYEKGAGNEAHPVFWLDDPIYGQSVNNVIKYTVNFDILGIPGKDAEAIEIQGAAYSCGLDCIEKLKKIRAATGYSVDGFTFLTLRNYYDNDAAGMRFTLIITQANPVDICAENFDDTKEFPKIKDLPDFGVEHPDGCAIFTGKPGLPTFKLGGK